MKKLLLITISLLMAGNIFSQNREFTLNGKLPDSLKDGWMVYLYGMPDEDTMTPQVLDSTIIENGQFSFTNIIYNNRELQIVRLVDTENQVTITKDLIIEPGIINLYIDSTFTVKDSPANDRHRLFSKTLDSISNKMKELDRYMQSLDPEDREQRKTYEKTVDDFTALADQFKQVTFDYIDRNLDSRVGEILFVSYGSFLFPEQLTRLYNSARPHFKESKETKYIMNTYVGNHSGLDIGNKFKDVELSTPKGNKVFISDYIGNGKVVLIDFWASWCAPCIRDIPSLVNLYNKYKDKGFEIVGISLDEHKGRWTAAIDRMKMDWIQLSDFGGWDSTAARLYGVSSIPQSFLVDKDGIIVGHDLRESQLINKIEELLKEE